MDANSTSFTTPFQASDYAKDHKHHLLLAASGSVATIKLPLILQALAQHHNLAVRIILTKSSLNFLQYSHEPSNLFHSEFPNPPTATTSSQEYRPPKKFIDTLLQIPNVEGIHLDEHEWTTPPWSRGSPILHIELRRWAHLLVIAPLSANTLAKITHGIADNLLSSVVRAWDTTGKIDGPVSLAVGRKRILVAPAMNTAMWLHPVTGEQIKVLEKWGADGDGWIEVLRPQEKALACGDVGDGAMKEWTEIVKIIERRLFLTGKFKMGILSRTPS